MIEVLVRSPHTWTLYSTLPVLPSAQKGRYSPLNKVSSERVRAQWCMAADDLYLRIYFVRLALAGDKITSICSSRHSTTHLVHRLVSLMCYTCWHNPEYAQSETAWMIQDPWFTRPGLKWNVCIASRIIFLRDQYPVVELSNPDNTFCPKDNGLLSSTKLSNCRRTTKRQEDQS